MNLKKMIGEKVILSPLDSREYERIAGWINDLEVTLGTTLAASNITLDKEAGILRSMEQGGRDFLIIARDSKQPIGTCGITAWDQINQWASVGIMIGEKSYHNQGCGTEALSLLCDYCLNLLNCHSVRLEVYSYNWPAIACYKKVGFEECGRFHQAKKIGGQWHDCILMELLDQQFSSRWVKPAVERRMQVKV